MKPTTSRRNVLKVLGLGSITSAIAPSVLLQACKEAVEQGPTYTYVVLNTAQVATVKAIQNTLLPATDTPAASEVGSVEFLDTFLKFALTEKDRTASLYRLDKFAQLLQEKHQTGPAEATEAQMASMFDEYYVNYEAPAGEADKVLEMEGNTIDASAEADKEMPLEYKDDAFEVNKLLTDIRGVTLESYFLSEQIGEEVMSYLPIPGVYDGNFKLADLPANGNDWSF